MSDSDGCLMGFLEIRLEHMTVNRSPKKDNLQRYHCQSVINELNSVAPACPFVS